MFTVSESKYTSVMCLIFKVTLKDWNYLIDFATWLGLQELSSELGRNTCSFYVYLLLKHCVIFRLLVCIVLSKYRRSSYTSYMEQGMLKPKYYNIQHKQFLMTSIIENRVCFSPVTDMKFCCSVETSNGVLNKIPKLLFFLQPNRYGY